MKQLNLRKVACGFGFWFWN